MRKKLAIFLVVHNSKSLPHLEVVLERILKKINSDFDINVLISESSRIDVLKVSETYSKLNPYLNKITIYSDDFFDYSGYFSGLEIIKSEFNKYDGGIFINDTIVTKHNSPHFLNMFFNKINEFLDRDNDFKFMVGPLGDGEFFFRKPGDIRYIPTYCFFLSSNSFLDFLEMKKRLFVLKEFFQKKLKKDQVSSEDEKYIGFFEMHKAQLKYRNLSADKLENKIITAILEKEVSDFYKDHGLLIFCDYGLKNQLLVKFQKKIANLLNF